MPLDDYVQNGTINTKNVDFASRIKRFMDEGVMPKADVEVPLRNAPIEDNPIVKQQAAIGYMWSNQIVAISSAAKRPLEAELFPKPDALWVAAGYRSRRRLLSPLAPRQAQLRRAHGPKATHHFDLVNCWLDTQPETVFAFGDLRFYGRENAEEREQQS